MFNNALAIIIKYIFTIQDKGCASVFVKQHLSLSLYCTRFFVSWMGLAFVQNKTDFMITSKRHPPNTNSAEIKKIVRQGLPESYWCLCRKPDLAVHSIMRW